MVEIIISVLLAFFMIWSLVALASDDGRTGWSLWPVFLLFFFAIWTGGLWLTPVGPPLVGVHWLPFVLVAIFIALFWTAVPPAPKRTRRTGGRSPSSNVESDAAATAAGLGVLFWLLLFGLAVAAAVRYAVPVVPVAQAS